MTIHAPHDRPGEYALCGKFITRNDPESTSGVNIDCPKCLDHLENGTNYETRGSSADDQKT